MANKSPYICILYEVGDRVSSRYKEGEEEHEVVKTEFKKLKSGVPYQLIWLDNEDSFPVVASHYLPIGDTIEKYKNGLPTYNFKSDNIKVKATKNKSTPSNIPKPTSINWTNDVQSVKLTFK